MTDNFSGPVFIIGLPRSASKWIMHSINEFTDCCIVHEMHIKRLWRKGNDKRIRNNKSRLRELVISKEFIGCYWTLEEEYTVHSLTTQELDNALENVDDGFSLMDSMMVAQMKHYGKKRPGARHPVHYAFLPSLLKWYPAARILFLTRPMNEIARSWMRKKIDSEISFIKKIILSMAILAQSYANALISIPFRVFFRRDPRVMVVRYHDLVDDPADIFEQISNHIGEVYSPQMADSAQVFDSAYQQGEEKYPE